MAGGSANCGDRRNGNRAGRHRVRPIRTARIRDHAESRSHPDFAEHRHGRDHTVIEMRLRAVGQRNLDDNWTLLLAKRILRSLVPGRSRVSSGSEVYRKKSGAGAAREGARTMAVFERLAKNTPLAGCWGLAAVAGDGANFCTGRIACATGHWARQKPKLHTKIPKQSAYRALLRDLRR